MKSSKEYYAAEAKKEFDNKNYREASRKYQEALDSQIIMDSEDYMNLLCNQATCYRNLEEWQDVFKCLFLAISTLNVNNAQFMRALRKLEECCVLLGNTQHNEEEIIKYIKNSVTKMSENNLTQIVHVIKELLKSTRMYSGKLICLYLLKCDGQNQNALLSLSDIELLNDNYEQALAYAKQAHNIRECAETHCTLARAYVELPPSIEKSNLTLEHINKAIEINGDQYLYFRLQSAVLMDLGEIDAAYTACIRMYEIFSRQYPVPEYFHFPILCAHYRLLACIAFGKKNFYAAISNVEKALEYDKTDSRSHLILGYLLLEQGENKDARDLLGSLFKQYISNPIPGIPLVSLIKGLGFAHLYLGEFRKSICLFEYFFDATKEKDLEIAIGLYDAYLYLFNETKDPELIKKVNSLCFSARDIRGFSESTTQCALLFKEIIRQQSHVVVYIWNPLSEIDYGHAAIEVTYNNKTFYFSWFPSGEDYDNLPCTYRDTPQFYGRKHHRQDRKPTNTERECARARILALFDGVIPENIDMQVDDLLRRGSDKGELHKSATYKIFFRAGINFEKLIVWWRELLSSKRHYALRNNNCCDVVLHSLQYALEDKYELSEIKTRKMIVNNEQNKEDVLFSHKFKTSTSCATKATTVYKYCYLLACAINNSESDQKFPVIIRYNRWDRKTKKIIAFDFDPTKFDPNPMTRTEKMDSTLLFTNVLNKAFSDVLFGTYSHDIESINPHTENERRSWHTQSWFTWPNSFFNTDKPWHTRGWFCIEEESSKKYEETGVHNKLR